MSLEYFSSSPNNNDQGDSDQSDEHQIRSIEDRMKDSKRASNSSEPSKNLILFNHETITIEQHQQYEDKSSQDKKEPHRRLPSEQVQLSDFIGEHGAYQLAITALLFIRYVFLGLMANSGPLMTPDVTFYCDLPMTEVLSIMPNISNLSPLERDLEIKEEFKQICQIDLHLYQNHSQLDSLNNSKSFRIKAGRLNSSVPRIRECVEFTYDLAPDHGRTMTSEFDLVCDRDWLRSLYQSLLSASIVVAHVFWGTFSDKYGRFQAQRLCIVVSLLAGIVSIFAIEFWTFTMARAFCSFGDLGLVVSQTTIVVELVGQRYRGLSVALVNFGFALGVSLLPYVMAYFEDFRLVTGFTVLCHMITMPFILATNESPRWQLTNRKFKAARRELKRIARWNKAFDSFWQTISFTSSDEISQHQPKQTQGEYAQSKKLSSKEQKENFEMLLKKFIEQIEMQNLYDPVASEHQQQQTFKPLPSSPKISATILSQPPPMKEIQHLDAAHENQTVTIHVGSESQASRRAEFILEPKNDINNISSDYSSSSMGSDNSMGDNQDRARRSPNMRRAISCNELDKHTPPASMNVQPEARPLDLTTNGFLHLKDQQNSLAEGTRWKTLTLPVVSRAASSIGEDLDDDDSSSYQPIRRRVDDSQASDCITSCNIVAHQLSFVGRVSRLFKDKKLMIAVFTIVWTTFNSELLYTSFIIINLEVGEDVYLNYILGGCMEALAAISASLMLSYSPRRVSLIAFWLLISMSCFGLSLAHIDSTWAVWMLALAKFSQSSLSSIASVAAYESFPTFLRQSGSGLVFTLGMMGSVFAPLIFAEFDDHAGMDRVLMTFSCSSLIAAILIYLFLNETRGCELM